MTKAVQKKVFKRIVKGAKVAPKRIATEFDKLAKTKVKWL